MQEPWSAKADKTHQNRVHHGISAQNIVRPKQPQLITFVGLTSRPDRKSKILIDHPAMPPTARAQKINATSSSLDDVDFSK